MATTQWILDPTHSELGFKIKHLMISNVKGNFTQFEASIDGEDFTKNVEYGGTNKDPWGNEKMAFAVNGKLNRSDFGLTWNAALETSGVLVSEEVKITAEVQFVKQVS